MWSSPKNFVESWSIWIGQTVIDPSTRVSLFGTAGFQTVTPSSTGLSSTFAFCGGIGTACVDLLNRVFNTLFIDFLLRATKQERKSAQKIKVLWLSRHPRQCILHVSENTLQQVETFMYLGVVFTSDGSRNKGIDTRISKANAVLRGGGSSQ